MSQEATLKRLQKGLIGAASGTIKIVSRTSGKAPDGSSVIVWEIFSRQSNPKGATYFVGFKPASAEWRCTCPDFQKRGHHCKHILLVMIQYQQRVG